VITLAEKNAGSFWQSAPFAFAFTYKKTSSSKKIIAGHCRWIKHKYQYFMLHALCGQQKWVLELVET